MKITEAKKLKIGDVIYEKIHGYKMTIESIEESDLTGKNKIIIGCRVNDSGLLFIYDHKEVIIKN